jgi:hypothetical protein
MSEIYISDKLDCQFCKYGKFSNITFDYECNYKAK